MIFFELLVSLVLYLQIASTSTPYNRPIYQYQNNHRDSRFLLLPISLGKLFGGLTGQIGNHIGGLTGLNGLLSTTTCQTFVTGLSSSNLKCTSYIKCIATGGSIVGICSNNVKSLCCANSIWQRLISLKETKTTTTTAPTTETSQTMEFFTNDIPAESKDHTIKRISSNYCQVRVDFVDFNIEQPDGAGVCRTGKLTFSPSTRDVPEICGENTGQHVYLDFEGSDQIKINVDTLDQGSRWNLKTTQIPCDSDDEAPKDCLQYFTNEEGLIESFNFPGNSYISETDTYQLSDSNYKICVGKEGSCSKVEFKRNRLYDHAFTLSGRVSQVLDDGGALGSEDLLKITDTECTRDFIKFEGNGVYQPEDGGPKNSITTFCGLGFADSVEVPASSATSPFKITVNTDQGEIPVDDGNAGFSLEYELTC